MEEDDEMEVEQQQVFDAYEIDVDYEFEAPMFFDFSRQESEAETYLSEHWFVSAQSHPHSPFAEQMILREKILSKDLSTLRSEDVENASSQHKGDLDIQMGPVPSIVDVKNNGIAKGIFNSIQNMQTLPVGSTTGLTSHNKKSTSTLIAEKKSGVKSSLPRSSTLMKPTLSQLAKQNRPRQVGGSRFISNKEKSLCSSSRLESQPPKRQKLEGGQSHKVAAKDTLTHLVHKAPKQDGIFEAGHLHAKMKLTIPREPVLETALRAYRLRDKSGKELEHATSTLFSYRARPLNRKFFEAPAMPLPKKITPKLSEFQGVNGSQKFMVEDKCVETKRLGATNAAQQKECGTLYTFKAHPRMTFASKGDQSIFRNSKRGTAAPVRRPHNPPTELFSKLSLKSELHPSNGSHLEVHKPISICKKGLKENRANIFQQNEVRHTVKGKPPIC